VSKELRAAINQAIAAAEFEEAELRGKGVVLSLVPTAWQVSRGQAKSERALS
jgi:hypothetical protein